MWGEDVVSREKHIAIDTGNGTTEVTSLVLMTNALRVVRAQPTAVELASPGAEEGATRRTARRVERMVPSSKHAVKSNSLSVETGFYPPQ
jgi:hypothetical protein